MLLSYCTVFVTILKINQIVIAFIGLDSLNSTFFHVFQLIFTILFLFLFLFMQNVQTMFSINSFSCAFLLSFIFHYSLDSFQFQLDSFRYLKISKTSTFHNFMECGSILKIVITFVCIHCMRAIPNFAAAYMTNLKWKSVWIKF